MCKRLTDRSISRLGTKIVSSITLTAFTNFSISFTMLSRENSASSLTAMRRNEFLQRANKFLFRLVEFVDYLFCFGYLFVKIRSQFRSNYGQFVKFFVFFVFVRLCLHLFSVYSIVFDGKPVISLYILF